MKRTRQYIVNHKPRTWAQCNNPKHTFSPGSIRYDVFCGLTLESQHNNEPLFDKPIHLEIIFYFSLPHNNKKNRTLDGIHTYSPHLPNLLDFLLDIMKDTIITNNSIVASLDVKKLYAKVPMTKIIIKEIE